MVEDFLNTINNETSFAIFIFAFAIAWFIQLFYYLFFYSRITNHSPYNSFQNEQFPVSIIICARNESKNLDKFLPKVLGQNYPEYEVIVVNDCSSDNTEEILLKYSKEFSHLSFTTIYEDDVYKHGKKLALTIGIKRAKFEWMVLTDADCVPDSKNWISKMQRNFVDNITFVLAFGGYFKKKGLLNKIIRFDTAFIAMQFLGFAKAGIPYMGVGRNLAYRKSHFINSKAFASHIFLKSGDDDLYINKHANKKNTRVELDKESFTHSGPETSFENWGKQKRRHLTTGKYYKFKDKLFLALELFSRVIFFATFIGLVILEDYLNIIIGAFLIRVLIQYGFFYKSLKHFKSLDVLPFVLIFDFLFPFINASFSITNYFRKRKSTWK